jgi:rubrerythrin
VNARREWVCSDCDCLISSTEEPTECPLCGLPAAKVLSLIGEDDDEPKELRP